MKTTYYSNEIELKNVYSIKNTRFTAIGGIKSRHNSYDSFQRMIGHPATGNDALLPVTRKIHYKSNPSLHKCDARCMGATGHDCQCECGGKNHGVNT